MSDIRYYIAYGSNLNLAQMAQRCPTARVLGVSQMCGWTLRFRDVATIERCKGASVPILIWGIYPSDEEALDRYEGWPHLYRKERHRVYLAGKQVSAMVYIMNESQRSYCTPSLCYYHTIREGYIDAGFDVSVLDQAVAASRILARGGYYPFTSKKG